MVETLKASTIGNNLVYNTTSKHPNHNQYHGIYISDSTEDILVKNNVVYGCREGSPMYVFDRHGRGTYSKSIKIINNTFVNDNPYRVAALGLYGSQNVVRNNIFYNRAPKTANYNEAIHDRSGSHSGTIIENNISNAPKLCELGCPGASIKGNLLSAKLSVEFISSSANNFRLQSTAISKDRAPLTGFGTRTGAPTNDFDGVVRFVGKAPDIGAFERK